MHTATRYERTTTGLGVATIGFDTYAVRSEVLPSGVTLYSLRKWDGTEHTVTLGTNNRWRCTCEDHNRRRRTCKHINAMIRHGHDIGDDLPELEFDSAERAEELDAYYDQQFQGV